MSSKAHSGIDDSTLDNATPEVIEGGDIVGVDNASIRVDPLKRHRAATSRKLAYSLITLLALTIGVHYVFTAWLLLSEKQQMVETLNSIYSTWLPVISGLAGSAVTYFFTRED